LVIKTRIGFIGKNSSFWGLIGKKQGLLWKVNSDHFEGGTGYTGRHRFGQLDLLASQVMGIIKFSHWETFLNFSLGQHSRDFPKF